MPVNQLPVALIEKNDIDYFEIYIKVIHVIYDKLVSAQRSMQVGGERKRGPSTKQLVPLLNFVLQPSLTIQRLTLPIFSYIHYKQIHCSLFCKLYTVDQVHNNWYPWWALSHYQFWPTPFVFHKKKAFLEVYTINRYIVHVISLITCSITLWITPSSVGQRCKNRRSWLAYVCYFSPSVLI